MLSSEELRSLISSRGVDTGESILARDKRERLFLQHVKKNSTSRLIKKNRGKTPGGRTLLQSYLDDGLDANPADTAFTILQKSLAGTGKGVNKAKLQQLQSQPFSLPAPLSPLSHGLAGISVLRTLAPSVAGAMYHSSFTLLDRDQDGFLRPGDVAESLLHLRVPFVEEAAFLDGYSLAAVRSGAAEGLDFPSFVRICRRDLTLRLTNLASWLSQNGPRQALAAAAAISLEHQSLLESEAKASEARRNTRLKNKILREFTPGLTEHEEALLYASEMKSFEPPPQFAKTLEVNDYKGISGMFFQSSTMDSSRKASSSSLPLNSQTLMDSSLLLSSSSLSSSSLFSLQASSTLSPKFRAETPIPLPPLSTRTDSGRVGTALSQTEDDSEIEALLLKPWSQMQNDSNLPFVYGPATPSQPTHFSRRTPPKQQSPPSSSSSSKNERRRKFDVELSDARIPTTPVLATRRRRKSRSPETSLKPRSQVDTPLLNEQLTYESNVSEISKDSNNEEDISLAPVVIHSFSSEEITVNPHLSSFSGPSFTIDSFRASSVGFGAHSVMTGTDEQIQQRPSSLPSPTQPGGSFSDFSEKRFGVKNARMAHALLNGLPPARGLDIMMPHRAARSESPPSALKRVSRDGTPGGRSSRSNSRLRVEFNVDAEGRPSTSEQQLLLRSETVINDSQRGDSVIEDVSSETVASQVHEKGFSEEVPSSSIVPETDTDAVDFTVSISVPSLPIKSGLSWDFDDVNKKHGPPIVDDVQFSIPSSISASIALEKPQKYDLSILGRYEGAKRMIKALRRIVRRRLRPFFNAFVNATILLIREEYVIAAVKIQAIARGFITRTVILPQKLRLQTTIKNESF